MNEKGTIIMKISRFCLFLRIKPLLSKSISHSCVRFWTRVGPQTRFEIYYYCNCAHFLEHLSSGMLKYPIFDKFHISDPANKQFVFQKLIFDEIENFQNFDPRNNHFPKIKKHPLSILKWKEVQIRHQRHIPFFIYPFTFNQPLLKFWHRFFYIFQHKCSDGLTIWGPLVQQGNVDSKTSTVYRDHR